MAKDFAVKFYHSTQWQTVRQTVISRSFGLCERCRKKKGKIVHHIIHLTARNINNPSITLGLSNLMLLCKSCHEIVHSEQVTREGLTFDERGRLIKL